MAYDINKILSEYGDNDFGFTAVDEAEYQAVIAEKDETVEEYKARLQQVEKIIMPFLTNLYKSASQPYIHLRFEDRSTIWPMNVWLTCSFI